MPQPEIIFTTRKPDSELLRQYISYYYFHIAKEGKAVQKLVYYPNTINALTIYHNSELSFGHNYSAAHPVLGNVYHYFYAGVQQQFRVVEITPPFDKIAIAFEPLGINAMIRRPLSTLLSKGDDLGFNYFGESLNPVLDKVYKTDEINQRVALLDTYFLTRIIPFEDQVVRQAIDRIAASESKLKVYDIAADLGVSQKTLNRHFQQHLNVNVKDYIEVAQFRRSFNHYLNHNKSQKLTDLAYETAYYDQSEFIRQFRKITGINPKKLFSGVERFGEEELFWNIRP